MRTDLTAFPLQDLGVEPRQHAVSVTTSQDFLAPPEIVWDALLFYEEITECPPLVLRLLLPKPIGTEGCKREVGREVKCRYEGGHLIKRITEINHQRSYTFEVTEQALALGGIRLLGGNYALSTIDEGQTRVDLTTRYTSPKRPRWLCRWIEAGVCHLFHRYILTTVQSNLSRRQPAQGNT